MRGRQCEVGLAGWRVLAGALVGLAGLVRVNGWEGFGRLREGGLEKADLVGTELALVATLLLPRSTATLTALDARYRGGMESAKIFKRRGGKGSCRVAGTGGPGHLDPARLCIHSDQQGCGCGGCCTVNLEPEER